MKLRIRGNSVRIRLTRSEVAQLNDGKRVEQTTQFSRGSMLKSSVEPSTTVACPFAAFVGPCLSVFLPSAQMREWATSDEVTINANQEIEPGASLQILVEKDFECIHSRAEGNSDAFPNPRERHQCAV